MEDYSKAFESLKKAIMRAPTQTDFFVLCTDACLSGMGVVLTQRQSDQRKVILYANKVFQKEQCIYSPTKQELYALVYLTQYISEYVIGRKVDVLTGHRALMCL